ncbi:MAG: hypothetical protein QF464_17325, partial [Myxococcota bacterium]|jgi:hypothetical protein|nr:hypothetical protein [Myxococcota bacterium]
MRNRYVSFEARFRDFNGDGALDLLLLGAKERLTTVNDKGFTVFSAVNRSMPFPVGARYLRTPEGFTPVELTMSDLFEPFFNRAVKRLTTKPLLVATAYRDLQEAANILRVIAEATAHASPHPPEDVTDPTLYCLTVDNGGKGPVCRGEGLGGARAVDVTALQSRAVDMVRMWARIRPDVPGDVRKKMDGSMNHIFRWICKASESALAKQSPEPPPARPPLDPDAPPPPPVPVTSGGAGGSSPPPIKPSPTPVKAPPTSPPPSPPVPATP